MSKIFCGGVCHEKTFGGVDCDGCAYFVASPANAEVKDFKFDKDIISTKSRAVLKVLDVKPEWIDFVVT